MTYQGVRARPLDSESGRFFEVAKVRIGADGHVTDVLWGEVDASTDHSVAALVEASAADVVDAIHDGAQVMAVFSASTAHQSSHRPERAFVIVKHADGRECLGFDEQVSQGRSLRDMDSLDG